MASVSLHFCKKLSATLGIAHYSASDLIKSMKTELVKDNKKVENVKENQDVLISAIESFVEEDLMLLDGHFCLLDKGNHVSKIPSDVFKSLNPKAVLIIDDDVDNILERINSRDNLKHNLISFKLLQQAELSHAKTICEEINAPFHLQITGTTNKKFVALIENIMECKNG